jgi:hypothetical protein
MIAALFFTLGVAAGVLQALLLRRSARRGPGALDAVLRLLAVAGALVAAALSGHLLAAALGWASAFAITSLILVWRWT